jgi:type II secretory pathway component PulK
MSSRGGEFDPGLLEYVTVWSREPNTRTNGEARINVATGTRQELITLLEEKFGADRANQVLQQFSGTSSNLGLSSELEFYARSGLSASEYEEIERDLTFTNGTTIEGRVNVNTASEAVLACIPGIGTEYAGTLVAARRSNPVQTASAAWVTEVLSGTNLVAAGPYVTGASYVFTADIAAVGRYGRGYQRIRHVFDTSEGTPRLVYRRDLTRLGWALGSEVRQLLDHEAQQRP